MSNFSIQADEVDQRIDKYLSASLNESRNHIQKLIKDGLVLVNEKSVTPHYSTKEGDSIQILERAEEVVIESFIPEIVYECNDYLIVNKPAGLAVHGLENQKKENLADYLVKRYPEIKKVGSDPTRPGIAHRLDQGVSGLMIVARTQKFFDYIKEQFLERKVEKIYTALILGKVFKKNDKIMFPISRSSTDKTKMAAHPLGGEGRESQTEYRVLKEYDHFSLVKVQIHTGRTHQIRVHFKALNHPVAGDKKYGRMKKMPKQNPTGMFLHASEIGFNDLYGNRVHYKLDLPAELQSFLEEIK